MSQPIMDRLQPIFREVLEKEDLVVFPEMSSANMDNWDSLAHIQLVVAIEKEFKVHFIAKEIAELKNLGQMAALIEQKLTA